MAVTSEKLNRYCREMLTNCRQNYIVFKSRSIAKGSVTDYDDEIDICCLVTKNGLKPWFIDKFMDRLTSRYKFVVTFWSEREWEEIEKVPVKSNNIPKARTV